MKAVFLRWAASILGIPALAVLWANYAVLSAPVVATQDISQLPSVKACLLLGTAQFVVRGQPNLFYQYRIEAAQRVYQAGKCSKIVVSGDNRTLDYNEPEAMKDSLMALGVPADALVADYAGRRTLDSVVRFKKVFGQQQGIVISQPFHTQRALYIAQQQGMALVGFNAQQVATHWGLKTYLREIGARTLAVWDAITGTQPALLGPPVALE